MIEQINIALEQKGSGISQLGRGDLPSETASEKESMYIVNGEE